MRQTAPGPEIVWVRNWLLRACMCRIMVSRLQALGLSLLVLYFAFHAFAGEKGLGRWTDAQIELETRKTELVELQKEIELLRIDIRRLTPGSVDPDYVEALARDKLAFVYPGEIVLLTPERSSAN